MRIITIAEGGHTMLPVKEIQDSVMSEYLQGKYSIDAQWNLLITVSQGTGKNGRYVQVIAIDR